MDGILRLRQLIPPLTARTAEGQIVRAWDYKQKRNLVIAFLHAGCAQCSDWFTTLAGRAADLSEHQAVVLAVYAEAPPYSITAFPADIIRAADVTGHSHKSFLGREAFSPAGLDRVGLFVTDRYGELFAQWIERDASGLPQPAGVLSVLWQIQVAC